MTVPTLIIHEFWKSIWWAVQWHFDSLKNTAVGIYRPSDTKYTYMRYNSVSLSQRKIRLLQDPVNSLLSQESIKGLRIVEHSIHRRGRDGHHRQ